MVGGSRAVSENGHGSPAEGGCSMSLVFPIALTFKRATALSIVPDGNAEALPKLQKLAKLVRPTLSLLASNVGWPSKSH